MIRKLAGADPFPRALAGLQSTSHFSVTARLFLLVSMTVAALIPPPVAAHSWYPKRCCHDHDCHPADTVRRLPDGTLVLARGAILVRVPRTFPIEASPDGRPHFCVFESGWGLDIPAYFRRAADYIERILKGASPGSLPVVRPTKFDLFVNEKTAKSLGLTIPPAVLAMVGSPPE